MLMMSLTAKAQRFFNLTADEVRVDTLLPVFNYAYPLGTNYADSTYEVFIEYPEFIPMETPSNSPCLGGEQDSSPKLGGVPLGSMPEIYQSISVDRKQGTLHIGFIPLVYRDGQYQKLVSFKLEIRGKKKEGRSKMEDGRRRTSDIRHQTSHPVIPTTRYCVLVHGQRFVWQRRVSIS